jgi:hypothetical protein
MAEIAVRRGPLRPTQRRLAAVDQANIARVGRPLAGVEELHRSVSRDFREPRQAERSAEREGDRGSERQQRADRLRRNTAPESLGAALGAPTPPVGWSGVLRPLARRLAYPSVLRRPGRSA